MKTVSIIGAGNVGTTLGLLFQRHGFMVLDICNRSLASAQKAVAAIGAGTAVASLAEIRQADILVIATSDNPLQTIAQEIAPYEVAGSGTIVFHCSGATPSEVLAPLREKGAVIAGVHPVQSFTDPNGDADNFAGVWCGIEGDEAATVELTGIFTAFGGKVFPIEPEGKVLYHAGIAFACNYLFPIIEAGLACYERAGVPRGLACQVIAPTLRATIDNALRLGPGKAITGPIARGDDKIVANHLAALATFDPDLKTLYEVVGNFATLLSEQKGVATPEKIAEIRRLLSHDKYMKTA